MKTWVIPVTWEMCGYAVVEAETLEKAMDIARDEASDIPLPDDAYYVDESWSLSIEEPDVIRCLYNDHQEDEQIDKIVSAQSEADANNIGESYDRRT